MDVVTIFYVDGTVRKIGVKEEDLKRFLEFLTKEVIPRETIKSIILKSYQKT